VGAAVVRLAIIAKDTAEERGIRPNPLASAIAHLPRRMGYLLGPWLRDWSGGDFQPATW
jgi:hypothetical protein